ncbi:MULTISPECIES: LLM class flavin-dependent oxidoreductase [unclassified Pseudonocardia]|jgi:probable LLM family oxidoreductase|uniref:LLM class flavin-dependent oxidoreductase n=1 Tax=unclassified Pseudonocardia TaxID=2619320 RepID=UPI0009631844|nr:MULTISPECIES: LLM class flavin-dependent oxidoreductase [unclassified Pseudonocardia]MBN9099316.1 LLM class flavin-dependent oxidoreductase [Pseudonocardia sp.]OJY53105.1 MAG: luciferase [Pseudonocardia sp. 73-21]
MHIGIDSFVSTVTDPDTGRVVSPEDRVADLLEEVERADQVGLDSFGIGEHHRREYYDSAPSILLAAAAARTSRIRLNSAVTVLSADDPVRVFQQFATLDLVSRGRVEMVVGRGSFTEAFPLFGLALEDYDSLFAEKLDLLLQIRDSTAVHWSGKHRAPLTGQEVYPRPLQEQLPIWLGVGGTPESFVRAGVLGLPLMVAIIGGEPRRFRPLIDLYREAGKRAGHSPGQLKVGLHCFGFVGDTDRQAADDFYPGWAEQFTKIGRERGFPPPNRMQFDATTGPTGAYFIGAPETVAAKIVAVSEALDGIDRFSLQMTNMRLAHHNLLHGIELLGTEVAPAVRVSVG